MRNSCNLIIELDQPNQRYYAGDEVTGQVHVAVNKDYQCKNLRIICKWLAHGTGTEATGSRRFINAYSGEWSAGGVHSYPFSFTLPGGPCSYHGKLLEVDWQIEVRAEDSWSIDPREVLTFWVDSAPADRAIPYQTGDPRNSHNRTVDERNEQIAGSIWSRLIFTAVILAMALFFLFLSLVAILDDVFELLLAIPMTALMLYIAVSSFYGMIRNRLAYKRLGDLQVELSRTHLQPGDSFDVVVEFPSGANASLNAVEVTFIGQERVISRSDDSRTTHRHHLVDPEPRLVAGSEGLRLVKGRGARLIHSLTIPHDAPPSFHAHENNLIWAVEVHVDVRRWPDWRKRFAIEVQPLPSPPQGELRGSPTTRDGEQSAAESDPVW